RPGRLIAGISKQAVLVGAVVVDIAAVGFMGSTMQDFDSFFNLEYVSNYRQGMASTANSGFAQDVDLSTPGRAIAFRHLRLVTLIWGPFPWQMVSLGPLLMLPEMLLWWCLAPALLRGISNVVRKRFTDCSPIIVFSALLLIVYGLTMGNVGAAVRMRAQA